MLEESQNNYKYLMSSWDRLNAVEEDFVSAFYDDLFKTRPSYRELFDSDITAQKLKFAEMVNTLINSLNYLENLIPVIKDLGRKHVSYGVKVEDYDVVIDSFLRTLQSLSVEISDDEMSAWRTTLSVLKKIMTEE